MEKAGWFPERRRGVRVDLVVDLEGHLVTLDEQVHVRQLSLGGMLVETSAPLSPRLPHDFRISLGVDATTLKGRVVHSRVAVDRDTVTYVSGVQFVDADAAAIARLQSFLDSARAEDGREN